MAVLLFIGAVGLWERAHQISPELGLMLGIAAAQYGFALALRRPVAGGAMLGVGAGIAFLSTGLAGPVWIGLTAIVLPLAFAAWRTRRYARTAAVAAAIALVLELRLAARALPARARAPRGVVGDAIARRFPRAARPARHRRRDVPRQEPPLVRLARAAARALDDLHARPRLQRRSRDAGSAASGDARARDRQSRSWPWATRASSS